MVSDFVKGCERTLLDLGYRTQTAYPWTHEELQTVLQHLDSQLPLVTSWQHLKLFRDAFCLTISWDTCLRGRPLLTRNLANLMVMQVCLVTCTMASDLMRY